MTFMTRLPVKAQHKDSESAT